jgi:microcin C transport system ATP-binding protein
MALLEVRNLSVRFRQGDETWLKVVDDVSFSLNSGETLALVGESGSGKTVSAHSILGLLPYPMADHPEGSITYNGQELLNKGEDYLRGFRGKEIAMVFQEPMTALNPLHNIEKQITEPLEIHTTLTAKQIKNRVLELLKLVGFTDGTDRLLAFPHQLSGGQRQRVLMAMALACNPKILIADEPTTALDVTLQKMILDLIGDLQKEFNMGLLLISHDLALVSRVAHRIAVMKSGQIVEAGRSEDIFKNPSHAYTRHLINSEPSGSPKPIPLESPSILVIRDLNVNFTKPRPVLSFKPRENFKALIHTALDLAEGETLGIVGESGSGKSTLAGAIVKLIPSQGEIIYKGRSLHDLSIGDFRPLRSDIQLIFQDPFSSLNPRLTINQIIREGLDVHFKGLTKDEKEEKIEQMLKRVGLDPSFKNRYPHEFSGGQRQRIAIARSLILNPRVLILDEPTSALDRSVQMEIIELLKSLQEEQKLSFIFISHDLKVIKAMSHRIIVMREGRILEKGTPEEIFNSPKNEYTQNLIQSSYVQIK